MNKPQTFSIQGKEHQLKAIWEDLKELGYTTSDDEFSLSRKTLYENAITTNVQIISTKENYLKLVAIEDPRKDKTFQLPQQYQETLDFAKEHIKHPYWNQEAYKVGDWITVIGYDERYSYDLYHGDLGKSYLITKIDKDGLFFNENDALSKTVVKVRKATEEEIKSELLKQANERYPNGCKFKSVHNEIIENKGNIIWGWSNGRNAIFANNGFGVLYCDGKWAEIIKPLYFGEVEFTIDNNQYATTKYGKITKEELKAAIDYIENPPKLCGFPLKIHVDNFAKRMDEFEIENFRETAQLGFGCQSGKLSELKEIYKAICEF